MRPLALLTLLLATLPTRAAWFDAAWPFRRDLTVAWDADKPLGGELAVADVFTAGHHKPDGADVRVAADDGRVVPARVLAVGPGDSVRVAFALAKGQHKYAVYFGHPSPPKPRDDLQITGGLLFDAHQFHGGRPASPDAMLTLWQRSPIPIAQAMIPTLFLGKSPIGDIPNWIARVSGTLTIPADGEYTFAAAAHHAGLLCIDNKPAVFAPNLVGDTRYNAKLTLTKGKHALEFYHVNAAGEGIFSVVWKRPGAADKFELLGKDAVGALHVATPGALEENRKTLTADFKVELLGEAFFANHYTQRYRFSANLPKTVQPPKYEWDFGDGQTAEGPAADHVYLANGVYPIKLTARIASNADTQTTQFHVDRDVTQEKPKVDDPAVQSKAIEAYRLDKLPPSHLPWAVLMHERANRPEPMLAAAAKLAPLKSNLDGNLALLALSEATQNCVEAGRVDAIAKIWDTVPADSPMQPAAARAYASLLCWRLADFDKACKVIGPVVEAQLKSRAKPTDHTDERLYAQALILNQHVAEGAKILQSLPVQDTPEKRPAIAGAIARTIEYYVQQREPDPGEDQWERWQRHYPADFLEGYSLLLRVRLTEVRKQPEIAAKIAEAFALALPKSSYAPTLLDKASKLLAPSNPAKSADLRKLLKQKYPEDPLSQDAPPPPATK